MISAPTLERRKRKERIISENKDALWDPEIGEDKTKRIITRLKINGK